MGGGSYISIARISAFFVAVWCGSMASKKAGISTIVAEIVIGLVLGPRMLGLMPNEYAMCAFEDSKMKCDLLKDGQWHHIRGHDDLEHMVHEEEEYCATADGIETYGSEQECMLALCDKHLLHECSATPDIWTLIGHIGVSMMIFEAGMHVDFEKVRLVGVKACCVAVLGTFTPIILATLLIGALGYDFYPNGMAVGISLSPTSIGISLKLLGELGVLDRLFGQAIIVAAVVDDILALVCYQAFFAVASPDGGLGFALGKLAAGVAIFCFCAYLTMSHWPRFMEHILKDKDTKGKFSVRDQIHFFIMFITLLLYATGFNFIGSHLWGCFVGGLSFTAVPHSHHLWVAQTKRSVKWMIRIFFACTVGFSIPIDKLLTAKSFGYGMIIGAIPCLGAKVFCAPFMGDAKWVIGWGMCGRAEFAYYIAAAAMSSLLMTKEVYAITIWSLLCATIIAPFAFRAVLKKYTATLKVSHRATFIDVPDGVSFKSEYDQQPGEGGEQVVTDESTPQPEDKGIVKEAAPLPEPTNGSKIMQDKEYEQHMSEIKRQQQALYEQQKQLEQLMATLSSHTTLSVMNPNMQGASMAAAGGVGHSLSADPASKGDTITVAKMDHGVSPPPPARDQFFTTPSSTTTAQTPSQAHHRVQHQVQDHSPAAPTPPEHQTLMMAPSNQAVTDPDSPKPNGAQSEMLDYIFRIRACFLETVKKLEFEVEWRQPSPIVVRVIPNGAAERYGIRAGDCIMQLNNVETNQRSREDLLPILRQRPLKVKLERKALAHQERPYLLVDASFMEDSPGDLGMDVHWGGTPVVCAVREGSRAWQEGIFPGDTIHMVNGQPAATTQAAQVRALKAAFDQRPLSLALWRRPAGSDNNGGSTQL